MKFAKIRKIKFEGLENLLESGPVVTISNHTHWTDPVYVALAYYKKCSRQVFFMAKEELFRGRIFKFLLNKAGAFPVSRVGNDLSALKTSMRHLRSQEVLGIFPEGTRYHHADDDPLADFKQGAVVIAYRGKSPVIPIALENPQNLLKFTKPAPIVHIGEPIYFTDIEGKSKQEILDYYTDVCKRGILSQFE